MCKNAVKVIDVDCFCVDFKSSSWNPAFYQLDTDIFERNWRNVGRILGQGHTDLEDSGEIDTNRGESDTDSDGCLSMTEPSDSDSDEECLGGE
jgi:hypothetical protein